MVKRYSRHLQEKKDYKPLYWLLCFFVFAAAVIGFKYYQKIHPPESNPEEAGERRQYADAETRQVLQTLFTNQQLSWEKQGMGGQQEVWKLKVPAHIELLSMHLKIKEALIPLKVNILQGKDQLIAGRISLQVGQFDSVFFAIEMKSVDGIVPARATVAIVIDDFGDRRDGYIREFASFGKQMTFSILPGRRYSKQLAAYFNEKGCETMLHLPMEPEKGSYPDKQYLILAGMKPPFIEEIIQRALTDVPNVSGVNNHMGSRATSHGPTMEVVMRTLRRHNLYFVDSRTTQRSVAHKMARASGLESIEKDFFLDNELNQTAIGNRFAELIRHARNRGHAVGIGHCHRVTLQVLQKEIPRYRTKGIQFVTISRLLTD